MRNLILTLIGLLSLTAAAQQIQPRDQSVNQVNTWKGINEFSGGVKMPKESDVIRWATRDSLGLTAISNDSAYFEYHNGIEWVKLLSKDFVYNAKEINYPDSITFRPFGIYEQNGRYYTDKSCKDIVKDKISKMIPYYVNYETGSDSNNGLSLTAQKKTILSAYSAGARLIYLTGGIHKIDSWGTLNSAYVNTDDCFIIGIGDKPTYITSAQATTPTITLKSGTTYQATDANIRIVVDMKYTDASGFPLKLNEYFTLAEVNSNPGSYYYDTTGGILYFNLVDGRTPDADVLLLTRLRNAEYRANAGYHYVENVTFMGGGSTTGTHGVQSELGSNSTLVSMAYNCRFLYGQALNYDSNGGEGSRNLYNYLNWFENCTTYGNARDGFNYLSDPDNVMNVVEINCQGFSNGLRLSQNNVNGTSCHGPTQYIGINNKFYNNSGPNVAHVNGTMAFNVGVICFNSVSPEADYDSDFSVASGVGFPESIMYNYACQSYNPEYAFTIVETEPSRIINVPNTIYKGTSLILNPSAPQTISFEDYNTSYSEKTALPDLSAITPVNEGGYNTSFVDVLHNSSSIQSNYIIKKQDGDLDGFGLGYLVNGEAVQIDFYQDIDGYTRLYNVFSNTIDGNIMLLSGANRLSSGVLEFAVRAKKSGEATAYNWIPNHTTTTAGALTGIDTKIYIDGILTDVYALANDTRFVINDFVMIQKATGYNLEDSTNPLFNVVTTHKFKDGKLTITNNLTALDDLTMYDGYSGKITGYDPLVNKVKLDDETVITPTGSNAYTLYNAPIKSAVYYNSSGKYALAITCGSVSESTSNNKAYSAAPAKLLHWDRWPNNSIYFLWTPRDIEVEVPLGAKFTSTNEIFVTTNVEDIINP